MGFVLTAADYAEYVKRTYEVIRVNGDYVTELDLATGDGDHWSNINMGFEKLVADIEALASMNISDELKAIGKSMMAVIGGSSGVLYGSAYLAAAKAVKGKEVLGKQELYDVLEAMLNAIISRG
ncbi:MAG: DAK2 domain-containing protein, partial [Acetivibrio ethanolgignens]